jgi:hypothetical protein
MREPVFNETLQTRDRRARSRGDEAEVRGRLEPLDEESVYARFLAEKREASSMSPSPLRTSTRPLRRPTAGTV